MNREMSDEIRLLVRSLLKEALPGVAKPVPAAAPAAPAAAPSERPLDAQIREAAARGEGTIAVRITGDGDLQAFTGALAAGGAEAAVRDAVAKGKLRFVLAGRAPSAGGGSGKDGSRCLEMDKGMLNEVKIVQLAKDYDTVLVTSRVVLTPLARDRARAIGLEIARKGK